MAANRGLPVVEATECPSASVDSAPLGVPDVDEFGSPDQSLVDLLANLPDPHNPPDLSDHRSSRLGPTSPTRLASEGDDESMALSDIGQGTFVLRQKKNCDDDDDNDIVAAADDNDVPRRDKGKAPETAHPLSAFERRPNTRSYQEAPANLQQAHNPTEPPMEDERLRSSVDLTETATDADSESSSRPAQSEAQDASYPSSVFEEARDHNSAATTSALADQVTSWKQKQKQKVDPEAETEPLSEASEEEKPFQPPSPGDPGWEKSAGRPPQKLPVRFRDAVGRNFLFPWEKAKTWTGMKRLIQSCFIHVDVLGPHVMADRYDLSINLPFPMDSANEILSPVTPLPPDPSQPSTSAAETPSSSTVAGSSSPSSPSNGTNSSQQQPKSSFVVLPELWDDTIEPGMLVVQHMWPFQTPNYIAQPVQPSPPQPHHHLLPTRGRGAARGRGRGAGMFGGRGGVGGNLFAPPPHPGSRPPMIVVNVNPPLRGKTRKRQDRG
ncbi:hypothetical protein F5B21DRAFT_506559 [Xylaria acuta]|nr:hypothetical protein F5B21DRAFT_506559 [Xylaria acuta]